LATRKTKQEVVQKVSDDAPVRFRLGEAGYLGLNIFDGISRDELKKELTWPNSIKTFKQMSYHSAITSPLTLFENIISRVTFRFIAPPNATEQEVEQTAIMNSMLDDMEQPFSDFINDALSSNVYGFSVHEKVYRRRTKESGSKYDDNLIGWRKLPIRNQETIEKFIFSEDGNEIVGVKQNLALISDNYNRYSNRANREVVLPASKVIIFRAGRHRGDPYGKSMLRDSYLAWRYLTALEEIEAQGVQKDLNGLPTLYLPPQYMSPDASPEQKAVYEYYKNAIRNIQVNQQAGLILPQAYDPETRQPLFKFELVSTDGKKNYDINKIKEYYKNLIFTSMMADILIMGQSNTGSFALASVKGSMTAQAADAMLRNIMKVVNNDLVRQTYELNGWDTSRMATLDYEGLEEVDVDVLSRAFQRTASVGLVPKTPDVINRVLDMVGVNRLPNDITQEELEEILTDMTSRAGDGFTTPFEGTRTNPGSGDDNANNLENAP
jgi:hypothetical protein